MLASLSHQFQICVYGDSPSAATAAVQAARNGMHTVLAVPGNHVGGILVNGLGSNDLDNHAFKNSVAVGGIASEFYTRIAQAYGGGNGFRCEPHAAEQVFNELLNEAGVEMRFDHRLKEYNGVEKSDTRITALIFENGARIEAHTFIDGTVEGDLMAFAGVDFTVGREGNARYGESLNGVVHASNYRQFELAIDPYQTPGDPVSGLIATIQDQPLLPNGEADDASMGFCFRMVLCNRPENRLPIKQPANYEDSDYEIYRRYFAAGGADGFFVPMEKIPGGKTDIGSWHDLSANLYGYSHKWPNGTYAERASIYQQHRDFSLGLIWFLQNDPSVPEPVRAAWADWGLPKDEFTDNDHWPHQLYVRNGRRMVSDWIITEQDLTAGHSKVADDPIAVAFWPPDMHHAWRIARDGKIWNEGFVFGGNLNWRPFGISYRAIRPKASQCTNLLVPSALSSSYVGYSAVRIEWTFMTLGQSAACAATLAVQNDLPVQAIKYADLRPELVKHRQIVSLETNCAVS